MTVRTLLILIFFSLLPSVAEPAGIVNQKNDFQIWLFESFDFKNSDKITTNFASEFRYAGNGSKLHLYYFQGLVLYSVSKHLQLGPGYRQAFFFADSKWRPRYEPIFQAFQKLTLNRWEVIDRHFVQYRIPQRGPNLWVYRNRLMFICPYRWAKLNPYFYDEVFFQECLGFYENRFEVGAFLSINPRLKFGMGYMLRNIEIEKEWRRHNVARLQFLFFF